MDKLTKPKKRKRIFWHDAFAWGYKAEFAEEADKLEFIEEYELSEQALKMDVLVIKKPPDVTIYKNIGKIFREHNITEYKSPTDNLNFWNYQKVLSYAHLYSSSLKIDPSKITLTFVLTIRPRDLLKRFKAENLQITEVDSGVTYVTGGAFPVQILESKKLSAETNLYLQHLRKNWDKNDFNKIVQWFEQTGQFDPKNIYLSRLFEANEKITKGDAESMTYLEKTVTNAIEERANTDEVFRKQMLNKLGGEDQKETTLKLLKKGLSIQDIAEVFNKPIEWVENLAKAHQPSNT